MGFRHYRDRDPIWGTFIATVSFFLSSLSAVCVLLGAVVR